MNLLPFGKLPAHKPRAFVPHTVDLGDWPQIAPLFDQLESRAASCKSAAELERWLLDWSELNAALDEESSRRYIAMTCHTDSPTQKRRICILSSMWSPSSNRASSRWRKFMWPIHGAGN